MNNGKINSKIKLSNNSSFVILIFVILKLWNIGRSTFRRSKFRPPPHNVGVLKISKNEISQQKSFLLWESENGKSWMIKARSYYYCYYY